MASIKTDLNFNLSEVAVTVGIDSQLLRDWVAKGVVKPVVRGGRGRGCEHQFTAQQLLGLAIGCAINKSPRGAVLEYVGDVVAKYEAWSLSAVKHLLRIHPDTYSEEALAVVMPKAQHEIGEIYRPAYEDVRAIYLAVVNVKNAVSRAMRSEDMEGRVSSTSPAQSKRLKKM